MLIFGSPGITLSCLFLHHYQLFNVISNSLTHGLKCSCLSFLQYLTVFKGVD
ncbi:hypothetical protein ENTCAN_07528 [Enterobacter cancerogenus ATCC 35316]|nr:hypothetical protein ENTCAN_07528 [Enterobacter cancerogenus ATCC 35316]